MLPFVKNITLEGFFGLITFSLEDKKLDINRKGFEEEVGVQTSVPLVKAESCT